MQSEAELHRLFFNLIEVELEDSFEHGVSSLSGCLTPFCSLFKSRRRVFFSQLEDSFASIVGLRFVDAAKQHLLHSPLGSRADKPSLFEEVGGIITLGFFPFLVMPGHVVLTGLVAVLSVVNGQSPMGGNPFVLYINFHDAAGIEHLSLFAGMLPWNGIEVFLFA